MTAKPMKRRKKNLKKYWRWNNEKNESKKNIMSDM